MFPKLQLNIAIVALKRKIHVYTNKIQISRYIPVTWGTKENI